MASLVLWNSIAKRRRSISDTFYDNGLATLKGYLEDKGHNVEVIDWARDDFFQALSPIPITVLLRKIYSLLIKTKNSAARIFLGWAGMQLQEVLSFIQSRRLKKRLAEFAKEIKKKEAHIIGVKIWYGEAFSNAKYFVDLIKKIAPEVITIGGGYHATLYEENILKNSAFDLGVVCEGEYPFEKILAVINQHQNNWNKKEVLSEITSLAEEDKIENLIYRKNSEIFKTSRHEVKVYSSKSIPKYTFNDNKVRIHVMVESLGCDWGKCSFCVHPHFYKYYSLRSPDEIVVEVRDMLKAGIGIFRFAGSDTPPAFGARIAEKIIKEKLEIVFGIGSRAIRGAKEKYDSLTGYYETLIRGGLRAVFMGGESGNDYVNVEVMNKGVVSEDLQFTIKALREAQRKTGQKVYLSLALIYPTPLMGSVALEKVKEDNINLLKITAPDSVMITPPGPFLHTKWFKQRQKYGFEISEDIVKQAMEYEYVLYKPPHLWPKLGVKLDNKPFDKLLRECSEFRKVVEEELGIPTDISDEHFLMFYSAGVKDKRQILDAKKETMLDIISCKYGVCRDIAEKVNEYSLGISRKYLTGAGGN